MLFPNHLFGGFVVTATTAALCGQNILQSKTAIALTLICSVLPDIDNPSSPVGKVIPPLSKWINKHYGHRTVTHSFAALFAVTGFAWLVGLSPVVAGFAYFSHLLLDMVTLQGVPLFYGITNEPVHIPDNPKFRMRTGDVKSEFIAFGFFGCSCLFLMPLMNNGFWTTYNQNFATMKTVHSEFVKSLDVLEVEYVIQTGSQLDTAKGLLLDCPNENLAAVLVNGKFILIDDTKQIVKRIYPVHTGRKFYVRHEGFVGLGVDSLNNLLRGRQILEIRADANNAFRVWKEGKPDKTASLDARYLGSIMFQSLDIAVKRDSVFNIPNFSVEANAQDMRNLRGDFDGRLRKWQVSQESLTTVLQRLPTLTGFERETAMSRRDSLRREEKPVFDVYREATLKTQSSINARQFGIEREIKRYEVEKKYLEDVKRNPETVFIGFVKYISVQ